MRTIRCSDQLRSSYPRHLADGLPQARTNVPTAHRQPRSHPPTSCRRTAPLPNALAGPPSPNTPNPDKMQRTTGNSPAPFVPRRLADSLPQPARMSHRAPAAPEPSPTSRRRTAPSPNAPSGLPLGKRSETGQNATGHGKQPRHPSCRNASPTVSAGPHECPTAHRQPRSHPRHLAAGPYLRRRHCSAPSANAPKPHDTRQPPTIRDGTGQYTINTRQAHRNS